MIFEISVRCLPNFGVGYDWGSSIDDALDTFEGTMCSAFEEGSKWRLERSDYSVRCGCSSVIRGRTFTSYTTIEITNPRSANPYDYLKAIEEAVADAEASYSMFCEDIGAEATIINVVEGKERKLVAGELRGHVHHYVHHQLLSCSHGAVEVLRCQCGALAQRSIPVV